MIDIDTSTEAVAKLSDGLMMTARVGTDNRRHAQLMDDASNVLNALQAHLEGVEAKLAKAVELLTEPVKTHSDTDWLAARNEFLDKL
jgi:hypothetical protein